MKRYKWFRNLIGGSWEKQGYFNCFGWHEEWVKLPNHFRWGKEKLE